MVFLFPGHYGKHALTVTQEIKVNFLYLIKKKSIVFYQVKNLGGASPIPRHIQLGIETFLYENSSIASNRLVKNKNKHSLNYNRYIPARYLQENRTELFKKSPYRNIISKSTFFKYSKINGEFKNPHR